MKFDPGGNAKENSGNDEIWSIFKINGDKPA
jgi:hypothetical protein